MGVTVWAKPFLAPNIVITSINVMTIFGQYHFEHSDTLSNAGGVGLCIRNDLQYSVRTDITLTVIIVRTYSLKLRAIAILLHLNTANP